MKLKPLIAEKAKRQQARTAENRVHQISDKQEINTNKKVAKVAGVSLNKHSYTKSYLNIIHADDKNEPEG